MATTDHVTALTMSVATFDELYMLALMPPRRGMVTGARALRRALTWSDVDGDQVRVKCDADALDFIAQAAPEVARRWPAVFGDGVEVPRVAVFIAIAKDMIGQTVAGVTMLGDELSVDFTSGDVLVVAPDGGLDWRPVR